MAQTGRIFNIQKFSINDGPGIRTTVFFKGCPLQCKWCSNPESQNRNASIADAMEDETYRGREYTVEQVLEEVLQQMDFAMALADAAREAGVHVAVETTGYAQPERFREFMEHIDLFLFDFKHTDREAHFAGTGVYNDVILTNLQQLVAAGKQVVARIPVIPKFNSGIPAAKAMAQKLRELGVRQVHLLPFHQFGQNKYAQLGIPYEMEQMKQLHPEVLGNYQQVFLDAGLDCSFH